MKKIVIVVVGILIMAAGAYIAFAQRTPGAPVQQEPGGVQKRGRAAGYGQMGAYPMHGIMRAMMAKEMEVTNNGEVVVMIGCQLFKYDADLKLVAQTQVEVDLEAVQRKMQQMMDICPMRQQMMQQNGSNTDGNGNQN